VSKLKTSAVSRRDSVDLVMNELDDFFDSHHNLTTSLSTATDQLTSNRPITNDPSLISQEIEDLTVSNSLSIIQYISDSSILNSIIRES